MADVAITTTAIMMVDGRPQALTGIAVNEIAQGSPSETYVMIEGYTTEHPDKDTPSGANLKTKVAVILRLDPTTAGALADAIDTAIA
jgi:hypothetical protein